MKKISFFVAIAAAASLASCTAQAPKANMKNDVDSLSYMMGITNTQGLDMYMSQQLGVIQPICPTSSEVLKKVPARLALKTLLIWQVFRLVNKLVDVCSI